ncbi:hypothetical protein Taro_009057 [Colocasia esculenta]|uniref:Uncharacterized protein n=1 Tax=Colocasia esculenta TaxID=4460 RepID=A0A843TZA7_COLES|nr:hypothetical protein [Colocasia esculenta]
MRQSSVSWRACGSRVGRTLVLRRVLLSCPTRQSFVSLSLSALVPEPCSGARREAAAWPGFGVACVVCFYGVSVSPFAGMEAGARLVRRARGLRVPLLASSGGGLVLPRSASCLFWATVVLLQWFEVCILVGLHSDEVLPERLLVLLVEVLPRAASRYFGCRCSLSLCRYELSLFPVGLSLLQFAWALSVKVLCPWPCVWLPRWPACLVSHFQVSQPRWRDLCVPVCQYGLSRCHGALVGRVLVAVRRPVALRLLTRRGGPSHSGYPGYERARVGSPRERTLELRGKRGLDSGAESFVELSCLGLGRRGVRSAFLAQTRQSFVSLLLSALVPEPRSGARHEATAWPGCSVACVVCFCGGSVSPFAGVEAGARLVSRARGLRVPLLAASGGGLVAIVMTEFSSRRFRVFLVALDCTVVLAWLCLAPVGVAGLALGRSVLLVVSASVFSRLRGPILGCQPVMAPACVASRPGGVSRVRGGSAGSLPYFLQLGARRRGSSVSDGLRRRLWLRVVVSGSESECCELLYPSELRVVFCKSSGFVGGGATLGFPGEGSERSGRYSYAVSRMMTLHTPMGLDWSDERPGVIAMKHCSAVGGDRFGDFRRLRLFDVWIGVLPREEVVRSARNARATLLFTFLVFLVW